MVHFAAILKSIESKKLQMLKPVLLVSDNPEALVVRRAKKVQIPVFTFRAKDYPNKQAYEEEILEKLRQRDLDFIILAGYMTPGTCPITCLRRKNH